MSLTISLIPPKERADFEAQFAAAYPEQERVLVARHYLGGLLPDDRITHYYHWHIIPCGRGAHGLRLAIVETVRGSFTTRLLLVSGGYFVGTSEHARVDSAISAAWSFDWRSAEAA